MRPIMEDLLSPLEPLKLDVRGISIGRSMSLAAESVVEVREGDRSCVLATPVWDADRS